MKPNRDDGLQQLRDLAWRLGRTPTQEDMRQARADGEDCPSWWWIRCEFGSGPAAMKAAGLEARKQGQVTGERSRGIPTFATIPGLASRAGKLSRQKQTLVAFNDHRAGQLSRSHGKSRRS